VGECLAHRKIEQKMFKSLLTDATEVKDSWRLKYELSVPIVVTSGILLKS
jgi:hypothetical protein